MIFSRTALLIGEENLNRLKGKSVAVFGVGGVGGYTAEALCRSGIGKIAVFDGDKVAESNINRQIIATTDNIGRDKVDVIAERLKSVNPNIEVIKNKVFYLPENADEFDLKGYDYIVDAVDTVTAKLEIITRATALGVPVISSMGTGGKIGIENLKVADISETTICPLARVMRKELKKRGIAHLKVVYSKEEPIKREGREKEGQPSMIFVPAAAGLMLAREVVFDLIKE